jgi:ATP-binding cassette subfamily B protein
MQPMLGLSVILVFIPNIVSYFIHMVSFRKLENQIAPMRRKTESFMRYMTEKEYVKETRHLGLYNFFCDGYEKTLRKINELTMKIQYKKGIIDFMVCIITVLFYGGIIFMAYRYACTNKITSGTFAAVLLSLKQFYGFMYELIEERFSWASQNVISIENYLMCIEGYNSEKESCAYEENMDIVFENVYFSYPSSLTYALDNINLVIPYGQTIALVGENGSGKSTLCALLEGLYSPNQGDILFCKNRDKVISVAGKSRVGVSAVFQRFMKYQMSIKDNITISEMEKSFGDNEVETMCKHIDIHLDDDGIDAMLGREFKGKELSGGQWQRIAIARGIYRDCNLLIMDEPTSAIDPIEESKLFEKIYEYSTGKTAIIVTHRMALAKLADRVLVMKNGKIVQDGTHEHLLQEEGEYKELYQTQMRWYTQPNI